MTKRYAVRTLRLARHKNRRAALGRKLNMPKDKAALRSEAIALTEEIVRRWLASPHHKPEQSLAEFVHRYGMDELIEQN
jgi:hypothetical protein